MGKKDKSKAFEEGKREAWVSIWTLLAIDVTEVIISSTTGSSLTCYPSRVSNIYNYFTVVVMTWSSPNLRLDLCRPSKTIYQLYKTSIFQDISMILVPHDGYGMADKALKYAIRIAKSMNMKIKLVRVIKDIPDFSLMSHRGPKGRAQVKRDIEFLKKEARDKEYKKLERHLSAIKSEGVEASSLVIEGGEPGSEIISIIEKEKPYLVVIGSRKLKSKGLSKIKVLGSVARKLSEESSCPVLIVR